MALKDGKTVIFPTDTSYGLACDVTNDKAVRSLYRIKGRDFNKPIHVVVPSRKYAIGVGVWSKVASKLAKRFWPGSLSLVVPLKSREQYLKRIAAGTGGIGLRMPQNQIALDLAKRLGKPISATSANRSGQPDCYSLKDILQNFEGSKHKPDIIINAGRLPKRKPSTLVKVIGDNWEILRSGPVSAKQITEALSKK
jgi:L-threonylcarbamoyladenylate synthase